MIRQALAVSLGVATASVPLSMSSRIPVLVTDPPRAMHASQAAKVPGAIAWCWGSRIDLVDAFVLAEDTDGPWLVIEGADGSVVPCAIDEDHEGYLGWFRATASDDPDSVVRIRVERTPGLGSGWALAEAWRLRWLSRPVASLFVRQGRAAVLTVEGVE